VYFSYYTDGALLLQQAQDVGLTARPVTTGAVYNQQFITLGGNAVEGAILPVEFFAGDPRPAVQSFVHAYESRYHDTPDLFAAFAYDAVNIGAWACEHGGFTRAGIQRAMATGTDIPSIVDGPFAFGADRRVLRAREVWLVVKDGKFTLATPSLS
jgi:branched-chain amino acid transport system substrate-binding protein